MASKLTNSERSKHKNNYALYCVNIFGSGLKTIRDEFKRQINTGLRPTVFVIDLEDLQAELNTQLNITKIKAFKENSNPNLMRVMLNRIQGILSEYEKLMSRIAEELKFDLYEYWLKQNDMTNNSKLEKTHILKSSKKTEIVKPNENGEDVCTSKLIVKEHNRVGSSKLLSQRQYIKDEPILGKLYILILGQMSKYFLLDLLRQGQPVEAIINFMPTESNYDILLGNKKLRNFILSTSETINNSIFNLRQEKLLKPVGFFTHQLPAISNCLAAKNSQDIFDQLTWCIFDIDILRHQYENYYLKPFQVTDVEIPASVNLMQLYHKAETLSSQGRFQKSSLPTSAADLASIGGYLNGLLSTCGVGEDVITENNQTYLLPCPNAFSTITNIYKFDRLVVAENNNLLVNMLKYADLEDFNAMYLCCLDYNELAKFAISQQQEAVIEAIKIDSDRVRVLQLPQYVKYYVNRECSWQRITELKQEYDEYEIREVSDGYKLYIFKRNFYVLKEYENRVVIPTRLCFRDFTLFQMEEFLRDLKTSDLNSVTEYKKAVRLTAEFEKSIFVRPNSVKAMMMQNDKASEGTPKRKNETRARRKSRKGSSFSENTISEANQGLPNGHHLLQGYNLNDTLQEMKSKTSIYNFLNGCIKLYEEKWCFRDMNKQLSMTINKDTLFFAALRNQHTGISNNVRMVTENNISIRILNAKSECSKVVLNYPNGLSVYHHVNYCEQIWQCDKTPRDEQKRILTNFGAVIVVFKSQDIKIMRYNGEIYRLYQHELEEEEGDEGIKNKSSELLESSFQKQNLQGRELRRQATKLRDSKNFSSKESVYTSSNSKSSTSDLVSSVKYEVEFFNLLCATYGLTYIRFSITTSRGQVLNVTQQGKVLEKHHYYVNEWFDYFANEAYCERSDGVKMVWNQDSFTCFHEDGTVFKTTTEEDYPVADKDEFESLITESSSHEEFLAATEESYKQPAFEALSSDSELANASNYEVYTPNEAEFTQVICKEMFMQHPIYAQLFIQEPSSKSANLEIFAINGIRIFTSNQECNENGSEINEDFVANKSNTRLMVNVWIQENLKVKVDEESCEVYATIPNRMKAESDSLHLSLKYTDNINDAFNCWLKEIDSFKGNSEHELGEMYFMEKLNYDSSIRGFEFFSFLPTTSPYKYQMSNNIIELKSIDTINETMIYSTKEYENDLNKFSRFKQRQKESPESELPLSLSANVFVEIPQQLRNLTNITKFLEPFENICFKSLRGKLKDVLDYYLRPQHQLLIKTLCSKINWKKRICKHERLLFQEKQRRGLYIAMIKHKTYPNYWKFTQSYGNDVRCIEFFDFVQNQCNCSSD